eukprot:gene22375-23514_t
MTQQQFYTALRYIAMIQNGDVPISKERLLSGLTLNIGLPRFAGIDLPPGLGPAATGPGPVAVAPSAAAAAPTYAITVLDHGKYHDLFVSYDADRDGYLSGEEAMGVFRKSSLDPSVLQHIFQLADADKDGRLSSKEFAVAFHLILCNSKKGLPVPSSLPAMLKGFLANAPSIPGAVPAAPKSTLTSAATISSAFDGLSLGQGSELVEQLGSSLSSDSAGPGRPAAVNTSFSSPYPNPNPASSLEGGQGQGQGQGHAAADEAAEQLQGSVDALKQITKRALSVQEQAIDRTDVTLSMLT